MMGAHATEWVRAPMLAAMLAVAIAGTMAMGCGGGSSCEPESGVICTVAGTGVSGLSRDTQPPLETEFYLPMDMREGPDGNLYLLDWNNHRIRALEDGVIQTVVGTGELGDAPDGPALDSSLNHPTHVSFEADGNMIISAWHNSKILRYHKDLETVEGICGTGARDFNGDGLPARETFLDLPVATVVMPDGTLVFSDQANQRLRRLDHDEIVTTIAGTGEQGYSGDGGPAIEADLHLPVSQSAPPAGRIEADDEGNVYLADSLNHVIRKVDTDGIITTLAGTGEAGNGGGDDPLSTALRNPADIAVDGEGNVYIADTLNSCVRRVTPDGAIDTVAGICGEKGYEGDGGPGEEALLDRPYGVEVGSDGTLYIADTHNHVFRAVYP